MAVFTLTANSNYSAIKGSLDNGDTIRCDTFRLTVDEQPALTNITVDSPGTAGRMTVSGAYDMSTWSIIAGTVALIDGTFPSGATLGSSTGGSANNAHGIQTNAGTVGTATGGGVNGSHGIETNNGTVTTADSGNTLGSHGVATNSASGSITNANGGSGANGIAVLTNNGAITNANGGSGTQEHAVRTNNGTVVNAIAGSGGRGVNINNGTIEKATASGQLCVLDNFGTVLEAIGSTTSSAAGVQNNFAIVFAASDNIGFGVNDSFSAIKVVDGPNYASRIITSGSRPVTTVYSIGPLSTSASVSAGITVIEVNAGAAALPTLRGGFSN